MNVLHVCGISSMSIVSLSSSVTEEWMHCYVALAMMDMLVENSIFNVERGIENGENGNVAHAFNNVCKQNLS